MRSFAHYISKHLISFATFILILLFLNAVVFGLTFQKVVTEDYGTSSPHPMLEMTAAAATPERLSDDAAQKLRQNHIWAIYLNADGQCYWSVDLPENVPESYTIQDVALFSKGAVADNEARLRLVLRHLIIHADNLLNMLVPNRINRQIVVVADTLLLTGYTPFRGLALVQGNACAGVCAVVHKVHLLDFKRPMLWH